MIFKTATQGIPLNSLFFIAVILLFAATVGENVTTFQLAISDDCDCGMIFGSSWRFRSHLVLNQVVNFAGQNRVP